MKRVFLIALLICLIISLVACNNIVDVSQEFDDEKENIKNNNTQTELFENTDLKLGANSQSSDFRTRYIFEFYGILDFVAELVDEDILSNWKGQFEKGERSLWDMTLVTMVEELNIPEEQLLKANSQNGNIFTDEQISSLYSGNIKKVNELFANPYALVSNGEIFTPDWLATHTVEDYLAVGITPDTLKEYLNKINITDLSFLYVPISLTANSMELFDEKITEANVDLATNIISSNGRDITVKEQQCGKEYRVKLLFEPDHIPEENAFYWIRGTYDFVNNVINIMTPEGFHCPQRYAHTD